MSRSTKNPRASQRIHALHPVKIRRISGESEEEPEAIEEPPVETYRTPLIPSDCTSALEGTQSFSTVFEQRYCANGGLVPPFFIGSLREAISEAFDKPTIAERRQLAVYIHHDGSAVSRTFPEKMLCFDETIALLRSHFVLWPWDVTAKANRDKLLHWLIECDLFSVLSKVVHSLDDPEDALPNLLTIEKKKDGLDILGFCCGSSIDVPFALYTLTTVINHSMAAKSLEMQRKAARRFPK